MRRLSCKSSFRRVYECVRTGIIFCPNLPLIDDEAQMQEITIEENWTMPLIAYLRSGILPDGKDAARKLKVQASRFVLIRCLIQERFLSTVPEVFEP